MVVGLLGTWVLVVPGRLAPAPRPEELAGLGGRERLELTDARVRLRNDIRTRALQAIAGLAVLAGAVLAFQQLAEDREQAASDRAQLAEQLTLTRQGQASARGQAPAPRGPRTRVVQGTQRRPRTLISAPDRGA